MITVSHHITQILCFKRAKEVLQSFDDYYISSSEEEDLNDGEIISNLLKSYRGALHIVFTTLISCKESTKEELLHYTFSWDGTSILLNSTILIVDFGLYWFCHLS